MNNNRIWGFIVVFGMLLGCGDDKPYEPSTDVRCNAAYIMDSTDRVCYFGECRKYDDDLRNHYCPADMPLCIEDDHGQFYCGTYCPGGMYEVFGAPEFASMCKKMDDEPVPADLKCSVSDCLTSKGHENWINAECLDDGSCMVTECRIGYTIHNNDCIPAVQCCGKSCTNCQDTIGWESGECRDGKCIADSCIDGYALSYQNNGSVICELIPDLPCDDHSVCPLGQFCDPKTGLCICNDGLTNCGDACYDLLNDSEHCGTCHTICSVEHGSGYCDKGECTFVCDNGYQLSEDMLHCVKEGEECPTDCTIEHGSGYCDKGECKFTCDKGYELSEDRFHCVKKSDGCSDDCYTEHGSGYCDGGECKYNCDKGYLVSSYGRGCVLDGGPCTSAGEHKSESDYNVTIWECNDNLRWEELKTCHLDNGGGGIFFSDEDCTAICEDDYIQNADLTACDYKGGPCTEGEYRCNNTWGRGEHFVCHNNKWDIVKTCKYDDHVKEMTCTPEDSCQLECEIGYKLNADGTECIFDSDETCTSGETRCSRVPEFQRCVNNHWTIEEVCQLKGPHGYGTHCDNQTGCEYWCNPGYVLCSDACADFSKDANHCGSCDNVCASGKCVNGTCK